MTSLSRKIFFLFSRSEKLQILLLFALTLIGAGIEVSTVGLIAPFIAILSTPEIVLQQPTLFTIYHQVKANSPREFLLIATFGLIAFYFAKSAYFTILAYIQTSLFNKQQLNISKRLLQAYLYSPYTFHLQRNSAELIRNTNGEVGQIFAGVISPFLVLFTEVIVVTIISVILIIFQPLASGSAAICMFLIIYIFNKFIRNQLNRQGLIRQQHTGKLLQYITQALAGIKETKVLGREEFFIRTFAKKNQELNNANIFVNLANQLPPLFVETIVMVSLLSIVAFTLTQGKEISVVLQTISLFAIASLRLMPSIKRILGAITSIRYFESCVDVIYQDLVDLQGAYHECYPQKSESIVFENNIQLQNIHYQYPNTNEFALIDINLLIPKGYTVGFIGSSGAGKTTVIDIILGLLKPSLGQVTVDGKNIQKNLVSWQQHIGYIPQSIYLSDDTVRNNIAFGVPNEKIIDDKIWLALEAAQLRETVINLPEQLDTIVGERGIRLSGGQRQRVGIARALYHNPNLLIMDEATAALDNNTEREFMHALELMSGKKTIIMIAHRLSTVKNCDCLYLMNQGKIICSGTYSELMSQSEEFKSLAHSEPSYSGI